MSHEDSRYLSPEHRQLLRTGAPLPLTLTLLDHADYMDERVEQAESLVKELGEALERAEATLAVIYPELKRLAAMAQEPLGTVGRIKRAALARAAGTAETKA